MVFDFQRCALVLQQSGSGRFWRKFAAGLAAYVIALQAALSGLGLAALAAPLNASALPICSEHPAKSTDDPSRPANDALLCPCAPACLNSWTVLADAAAIPAFALRPALAAALSRCGSRAFSTMTARGPQIPRAPPTL